MARTVPAAVTTVLAASGHQCDWTLDLTFPNLNAFYYATSEGGVFNGLNGHNYSNNLESVGQIRNTLDAPADQVQVKIQNKDRIIGQYLAANWQQFRQADAILGRYYWDATRSSGTTWMEMFRGDVQQPNAGDFSVTFNIVIDTISAGEIVAAGTLNPICRFRFKDAKTCAYSGGLTTCNHHLASPGGCDGRSNSHHFGGTEHRYNADVPIPGTGDNVDDDDDSIFNPCPRIDQFVLAKGESGRTIAKMAGFVTDEDHLWHPIKRRFNKVRRTRVVKEQEIWLLRGPRTVKGFSSGPHPIIRDAADTKGTPVSQMWKGKTFLIENAGLEAVEAKWCCAVETGDVILIELDAADPADQIYCYGDSAAGPMIVCHNRKDEPLLT